MRDASGGKMESHIHMSFSLFVLSWAGPSAPLPGRTCRLWKEQKERDGHIGHAERSDFHLPSKNAWLHAFGGAGFGIPQ